MKVSTLFAGASTLISFTTALAIGYDQHGAHRKLHEKRAIVTMWEVVTTTAAEKVTVVHDQFGSVIATHFPAGLPILPDNEAPLPLASDPLNVAPGPGLKSQVAESALKVEGPNPTPQPVPEDKPPGVLGSVAAAPEPTPIPVPQPAPEPSSEPVPQPSPEPSPEPVPEPLPAPVTAPSGAGMISAGRGISWNPWIGSPGAAACKTPAQIREELSQLQSYNYIRLYSNECKQIDRIIEAGWERKLILGVYNLDAGFDAELQSIIDSVKASKQGWNQVMAVTIGNEDHVRGGNPSPPGKVLERMRVARGALASYGYSGPIAHVENEAGFHVPGGIDTCLQSDFIGLNAHAFFDPHATAENAGQIVKDAVERIKKHCGGKQVIVMESGWPHQGHPNGKAIPSPAEQGKAIKSLKSAFGTDIVLFSSHDDQWKVDFEGSFGAEKFWGILRENDN